MDHDPLCPSLNEKIWVLPPYDGECACERYAAVRADEREKAAQRVAAVPPIGDMSEPWYSTAISLTDAIVAARGE